MLWPNTIKNLFCVNLDIVGIAIGINFTIDLFNKKFNKKLSKQAVKNFMKQNYDEILKISPVSTNLIIASAI